jgi:hypothetical protein
LKPTDRGRAQGATLRHAESEPAVYRDGGVLELVGTRARSSQSP